MAYKRQNWNIQDLNYSKSLSITLFFVAFALITGQGAAQQEFEATPVDSEVNPQQTIKLTCRIRNRQGQCHWLKKTGDVFLIMQAIGGKYEYNSSPSDGDCSISVINTSLNDDDGYWQCQVGRVSLNEKNLNSNIVKLTVRNEPEPPIIEHGNIRYKTGDNFVAEADKESKFICVSKDGNPPAVLKWFIDSKEISSNSDQTNMTSDTKKGTFRASSSLTYAFQKDDHNKKLKCVALHATYATGSKEVVVNLNISYAPVVKLEGKPTADLAEGDELTLKCVANANPPAWIVWKKSGVLKYSNQETIKFNKISRSDAGYYSCGATNSVGESEEISLHLDVKFKPNVLQVSPPFLTSNLYSPVRLQCEADGNPAPRYAWLQSLEEKGNTWQHRGGNATLIIRNATYSYKGKYICEVSNMINGKEHKAQSKEVELNIVGPPQYLRENALKNAEIVVERDEDSIVSVIFCADPSPDPKKIYWEWGSVKIDLGSTLARYVAPPLIREELPKDCFEARLIIHNTESSDARKYTLHVSNDKGETSFDVFLRVKEPVTMSAVIGIVVGCIVVVVIVFLVVIYLLKKERCFVRRHGFHPESENSSQRLSDELQNGRGSSKDRAIPPDALYTDVQAIRHYENPEALKRSPDGIVYADLDLPALKSEKPKLSKSSEKIEYAEIQFKPNKKEEDL